MEKVEKDLSLVYAYTERGDIAQAAEVLAMTMEECEAANGIWHTTTLKHIDDVWCHMEGLQKADVVELLLTTAMDYSGRENGPEHRSTLHCMCNLGYILSLLDKDAEAEKTFTGALSLCEATLGPEDHLTLYAMRNLADVLTNTGGASEAESALRTALERHEKVLGENHPSTLHLVCSLGVLYSEDSDRRDDAEMMLLRAVQGYEKSLGFNHTATLFARVHLGDVFSDAGRLEDASKTLSATLRGYEILEKPEHPCAIHALRSLGCIKFEAGKLEEAEEMFSCALRRLENINSMEDARGLCILLDLAKVYFKKGDIDQAETTANRASSMSQNKPALEALFALGSLILNNLRMEFWKGELESLQMTGNDEIISAERWEKIPHLIDMLPQGGLGQSIMLFLLASGYKTRHGAISQIENLELAIKKAEMAISSYPRPHRYLARWLGVLAGWYEEKYLYTGHMIDIEIAIRTAELAVKTRAADDTIHAANLYGLSTNLSRLWERTGKMEVLETAVSAAEQASKLLPESHGKKGPYLGHLGILIFWRYHQTFQKQDLEQARANVELALRTTPMDEIEWEYFTFHQPIILQYCFQREGNMEYLEKAIVQMSDILETPEHGLNEGLILGSLSRLFLISYNTTGHVEDLDRSVESSMKALQCTPHHHKYRNSLTITLANNLMARFFQSRRLEDVNRAIEHLEELSRSVIGRFFERAKCLSFLGSALSFRFQRTGELEDLQKAVQNAKIALGLVSEFYQWKVEILTNLALFLKEQFRCSRELSCLEEAISNAEQAVLLQRDRDEHSPHCLMTLAVLLKLRFEHENELEYLRIAVETAREAVQVARVGSLDYGDYLFDFSLILLESYEQTRVKEDKEAATLGFLKCWKASTSLVSTRVRAASFAIDLLLDGGQYEQACNIAQQAIDILPRVQKHCLDMADQQDIMSSFSGIAGNAFALLIEAGDSTTALEYLEKGRAVILSFLMDNRCDISDLHRTSPDHARQFEGLREIMNRPADTYTLNPMDKEHILQARLSVVAEFDRCIVDIRKLPGHDRFLLGPSLETIQAAAAEGNIVLVNITRMRSDAMILSPGGIETIELPRLSYAETREWMRRGLTDSSRNQKERAAKNARYSEFLLWLWEACVESILARIDPSGLPRVWWIGCGLASQLPFHAAGRHSMDSEKNAFTKVISSYTPSIKTLFHTRERSKGLLAPNPKLLLVGMPTTPGHPSLPSAELELDEIQDAVQSVFSVEYILHPEKSDLAARLKNCDMVHFVCHGVSDLQNPSNGHLLLRASGMPGSNPLGAGQLTVGNISEMFLAHPRIAYLSACSTAKHRAATLMDETIHLVSAFQVIGFTHVLGTMWNSLDKISCDIASSFYQNLAQVSCSPDLNRNVAEAFHSATDQVRREWPEMPLFWAQFVHFGS